MVRIGSKAATLSMAHFAWGEAQFGKMIVKAVQT